MLWRSVLFSALFFAVIHVATIGFVHHLATGHGILVWLLDALGSIAATLLAMWLFLPVAATIGAATDFERIARAVERRFYPLLPHRPNPRRCWQQLWLSLGVGMRILGPGNVLALLLTLILPGIRVSRSDGLSPPWAIGRGMVRRRRDAPVNRPVRQDTCIARSA